MQKLIVNKFKEILQSVTIISDYSYTFKDKVYDEPREIDNKNDEKLNEFVDENINILPLEILLYRIYHCRKDTINENNPYRIYSDNRDFINVLSQNNFGTGMWEGGWKIVKIEKNDQIAAFKNDLTVWLNRQHFKLKDNYIGKLKVGDYGYVQMPKEYRNLIPDFYMVNGNELQQEENNNDILVRVYWNIQSSHSWLLVKLISTHLNRVKVPFRFKILNNPIGYPRADAAVLYIHKEFYKKAENTLKEIYMEIKEFLNFPTPFFAKTMAPGLSLAEDPGNGESFGQNRSSILAQSLYSIHKENSTSLERTIEKIDLNFKKSNIDINVPYLNHNSIDDYKIFLPNKKR